MAEGIILAAGYASRAQANKLLFLHKDQALIDYAIQGMKPFVSHIYVVTGHYDIDIENHLKDLSYVTCVKNPLYHEGMFSSVQSGVEMTTEDFFIHPGDCPFVSETTYQALLKGTKQIRVPTYKQRKGHPLFVAKELKEALLSEPRDSTLKAFRDRYDVEMIENNDPNMLFDIDTPADLDRLKKQTGV